MLKELGITRCAYDWRAEHVPTFEQEVLEYKKQGIEFFAFWSVHDEAFELFQKHDLHPQIWQTLADPGSKASDQSQAARVDAAAKQLIALAKRTKAMGCKLGLYNHGGWGGEPENLVAVCQRLRELGQDHVGIVYNFHHAHERIDDWDASLKKMLPYLHCINLNGMNDAAQPKILGIGKGTHELPMIRAILNSGYQGPIGILDHRGDLDARESLQENRDGLRWVEKEIEKRGSAGPLPATPVPVAAAPAPMPAEVDPNASSAAGKGRVFSGDDAFGKPPITVEVRATIGRRNQYNILVASETKQSQNHWELFSMNGSGHLTVYLPGRTPDHVASTAMICDGRAHTLSMIYESDRVRLYVDGEKVADQAIASGAGKTGQSSGLTAGKRPAGKLAIGRLVNGALGCDGLIQWVRISKGVRKIASTPLTSISRDETTVGLWRFDSEPSKLVASSSQAYDAGRVNRLVQDARQHGDAIRGASVFADVKLACLSCHKIGTAGGTVGPDLSTLAKDRTMNQIVESVLWPQRDVKPEYMTWQVLTSDGEIVTGYQVSSNDRQVTLRDPASAKLTSIAIDDIEAHVSSGTVMPTGLTASMTPQQQWDLFRFLDDLGRDGKPLSSDLQNAIAHAQMYGPATFEFQAAPIDPQRWPNSTHHVNRDRVYDFYTKQADHFRRENHVPMLLTEYAGLDGGRQGHWGNQNEQTWASDRWNQTQLGTVQAGVFHAKGKTVPRAVCVRLGDAGELSACFNPDTLTYEAIWDGGFVSFASVRHGFLGGLQLQGNPHPLPQQKSPNEPFSYQGYYRHDNRVVFAYRIGDVDYLDSPWVIDGEFVRDVAPADRHPLRHIVEGGPAVWPQVIETTITPGIGRPLAIDTIELPTDNPWNALLFCGGHDFLPDGSALVCTMQGDVWHVSGLDSGTDKPGVARWRRFASGLHHALGLVICPDGIFVQCRDQLTRLTDTNGDGEADFYECFSNAFITSPAGHDFICGLQRDEQGNFYTASGNQGILRISPDGQTAEVIATGFRNPDGLGLLDGIGVTVPCSEGGWTPASMICLVPHNAATTNESGQHPSPPHFGYGGPKNNRPPELPLAYLPRGLDNSSGGQTVVPTGIWGPLQDQLLHFSFGTGSWFTVLQDEVDGQRQGAVVPMTGDFLSGIHRGRFSPQDNQLYVSGMQGWGSYSPDVGCFQRIRYTDDAFQIATGFHVHENGVRINFAQSVDPSIVSDLGNHFAQCWNYRYSGAYGSPEYSTTHPGVTGHDPLRITSAHVIADGRSVFLEIPDLQPVNQLHLRLHVNSKDDFLVCSPTGDGHDLFVTVHRLDEPFQDFPGYAPREKTIAVHPMLSDMALGAVRVPNPWLRAKQGSRSIELQTGKNLTYLTRTIRVRADESIALTLVNPDVVPHNWVLVRPGKLRSVGELANQLISDPEAFARHYIPESDDVLFYTDIVGPGQSQTIHFQAPLKPGRYPFLCTFPGHWMVMNGELIVE